MTARVFLVDDHEVVRRGVADLVETAPDLTVVGEAATVEEALARLPVSGADVAVLDVRLPDGDGVALCRDLKTCLPDLNCLMLTSFADEEALFNAIMAGASGFVLKQILGTDLLSAIRTVASGQSLLDAKATTALLNRLRRDNTESDQLRRLTPQEQQVLSYIGEGLSNRQIATCMNLAEKTVKNYVSHVLAKLEVHTRTQAAVLAAGTRQNRP